MDNEETVYYDLEEAARLVAERTSQDLDTVENILEAEFLFNAALGVYEIPEDDEGEIFMEEIRKIREANEDILPSIDDEDIAPEEIEDKLVTFVSRLTGAPLENIEEILDEHVLYLEEAGILETEEED